MIDICGGNKIIEKAEQSVLEALEKPRGNFAMCKRPTNPIDYLAALGVTSIWRFISSHPDMDHLDGFDRLASNFTINNFWDTGTRKEWPDFAGSRYNEADWDRYEKFRDGMEDGVRVISVEAGSRFSFANKGENGTKGGDALYIASPDAELVSEANDSGEFNDASIILSYWTSAGKVLLPGDAHDKSWEQAINHHLDDVEDAAFLLAPHHGRHSDRDFSYLDTVKPKVSLLGCAPSEHLAYHAWRNHNLFYFTQNQAGNVVLEISGESMDVFIENDQYVEKSGGDTSRQNNEGYYYLGTVS